MLLQALAFTSPRVDESEEQGIGFSADVAPEEPCAIPEHAFQQTDVQVLEPGFDHNECALGFQKAEFPEHDAGGTVIDEFVGVGKPVQPDICAETSSLKEGFDGSVHGGVTVVDAGGGDEMLSDVFAHAVEAEQGPVVEAFSGRGVRRRRLPDGPGARAGGVGGAGVFSPRPSRAAGLSSPAPVRVRLLAGRRNQRTILPISLSCSSA